jgi:hypothetical protein
MASQQMQMLHEVIATEIADATNVATKSHAVQKSCSTELTHAPTCMMPPCQIGMHDTHIILDSYTHVRVKNDMCALLRRSTTHVRAEIYACLHVLAMHMYV